ncbi:hypothetical protein FJU08_07700 [Martelella alba]|uniref:Multiple sugar transport system ATP-binding protein n=1 Tax=Martelella alba TaxID=2590451 RepID=A0A506UEM8_9HYPH|nr:hypothetical protein [Martelella alba]TPW31621.1 hypothetical protein FJU08_07700 [Martelella alba]
MKITSVTSAFEGRSWSSLGLPFAARIPVDDARMLDESACGKPFSLSFVMEKAHVFDDETGANLTL